MSQPNQISIFLLFIFALLFCIAFGTFVVCHVISLWLINTYLKLAYVLTIVARAELVQAQIKLEL